MLLLCSFVPIGDNAYTATTYWFKVPVQHTKITRYSSQHLSRNTAENAFHAVRFANYRGRPLNHFITIDLATLGIFPEKAVREFSKLISGMYRRWRYQTVEKGRPLGGFDFLYVHENPGEQKPHVHMLVHLPEDYAVEFKTALAMSIRNRYGLINLAEALNIKEAPTPGTVMKYIAKGTRREFKDYFFMDDVSEQGTVYGRRAQISRSLNRTARKNAGWTRKKSLKTAA